MDNGLKKRVEDDMKAALRAQDKARLGTVRLLLAAIKQREIDERISLDDIGIIKVIDKMIKQRNESIAQYETGNRPDLVAKEKQEITVLEEYLPEQLSEAEVDAAIENAMKQTGATVMKDMGKIMGILKTTLQGRADMGAVSARIKARLQ